MNKGIRSTDGFKQDAVAQFPQPPRVRSEVAEQAAEIKRLTRELARVTEERTILKNDRILRAALSEVCVH